jgi:hypothetical protein
MNDGRGPNPFSVKPALGKLVQPIADAFFSREGGAEHGEARPQAEITNGQSNFRRADWPVGHFLFAVRAPTTGPSRAPKCTSGRKEQRLTTSALLASVRSPLYPRNCSDRHGQATSACVARPRAAAASSQGRPLRTHPLGYHHLFPPIGALCRRGGFRQKKHEAGPFGASLAIIELWRALEAHQARMSRAAHVSIGHVPAASMTYSLPMSLFSPRGRAVRDTGLCRDFLY